MFFLQRFPFEHFVFVLVALAFWWLWKFLWYEAFYFKKIILAFMFKRLVSVCLNVKNKQKTCVTMFIWRKYFEYEICIIFLIKLGWCWWTHEVWIKKNYRWYLFEVSILSTNFFLIWSCSIFLIRLGWFVGVLKI